MEPSHNQKWMADRYQVVAQQLPNSWRWEWEIYRNGKPMGIRLRGGKHTSKNSAETAGSLALRKFLTALERERGD
jgi:hypothetical protein